MVGRERGRREREKKKSGSCGEGMEGRSEKGKFELMGWGGLMGKNDG